MISPEVIYINNKGLSKLYLWICERLGKLINNLKMLIPSPPPSPLSLISLYIHNTDNQRRGYQLESWGGHERVTGKGSRKEKGGQSDRILFQLTIYLNISSALFIISVYVYVHIYCICIECVYSCSDAHMPQCACDNQKTIFRC